MWTKKETTLRNSPLGCGQFCELTTNSQNYPPSSFCVSVSVRKVRVCVVIRDKKVTRNMGVGIISKFGEGATAFRPVRQRLVIRQTRHVRPRVGDATNLQPCHHTTTVMNEVRGFGPE